jgi:hypothetical protein
MKNILYKIEKKYSVKEILLYDEQIWPLFRAKYHLTYKEKYSKNPEINTIRKKSFIKKIILLKNILYGWINWFHRYDYIFISTSREGIKKLIKGKYYDRLIDPIIKELKINKCLYIEKPYGNHYPIKKIHKKHIVSYYPILFISYILEKLIIKNVNLNGKDILNFIKKEYRINLNDDKIIKFYLAQYNVFKFIFKHLKPKAIFIVCYYTNFGAIRAAKELGIKVIEVQHGIIGKEHPAYNIDVEISKKLFPDYILTFGKQDVDNFIGSYFINPKDAIPIGSYYIEYLKSEFVQDKSLYKKIDKFRSSIGVTLQFTIENQTIEFIREAAILDPSLLFILIPRLPVTRDYTNASLPVNVWVLLDRDFYELMMYMDYHATVYSTCALEAPSFGLQNIMININNLSKEYFKNTLSDEITTYVNTPQELINTVNNIKKLDKNTVYHKNEKNIMPHYKKNLRNALSIILNDFEVNTN